MDIEEFLGVFSYNRSSGSTTCMMCNKKFNGFVKWNLKRHYETCITKHSGGDEMCSTIAKNMHTISFRITTQEIVISCLKMVTIQGKPFTVLGGEAFQTLFKPVSLIFVYLLQFIYFLMNIFFI